MTKEGAQQQAAPHEWSAARPLMHPGRELHKLSLVTRIDVDAIVLC
jgi:hypothetical protein